MTLTYPDAVAWARSHSRSQAPRLGMLEAYAFQRHPEVVATFGADGAAIAGILTAHPRSRAARVRDRVLVPFVILGVLAPVIGMAALGNSTFFQGLPSYTTWVDPRIGVPGAVIAFWLATVMLLVIGAIWLARGARWSGLLLGFGVISAFCGVTSAFGLSRVHERDGYVVPDGAVIPMWATVGLGVILIVSTLARYRVRAPQEGEAQHPRSAEDAPVSTVPGDELAEILADRDAALQILADDGLIDDERLRTALAAPPGTLHTLDDQRQ